MKYKKKFLFIVMLVIMSLFFVTISYGFGVDDLQGKQVGTETIQKAGNGIVRVISVIGTVISVVMLVILGIKYMMGSTDEKATYKKSLMPYVIGAVLVFAASQIAQLIYNLANEL